MESNNSNYVYDNIIQVNETDASRRYLAKVFTWMFAALGISALVALEFNLNHSLMNSIVDPAVGGFTGLGYVAIFSPVILSFILGFGYARISYPVLLFLFILYAVATGVSLSILGLIYTASSIVGVFLSSAVIFAVMAIAGYTTKTDLTKLGSILVIAFFGLFAVGLLNFFMGSSQLQYFLSFGFVIVMVGLTAYYMQMLKRIGAGIEYGNEAASKLVLIGAFVLYTSFINLFISMMRIFGGRK